MHSKTKKRLGLGIPLLLFAVTLVMNFPQIRRYIRTEMM
jgi:hypothetical protein